MPIEITISRLREKLEQMVPLQRHQQAWQRHRGIDIRYRLWRGPLALWATSDRLHLSAPVGYWVSARKKVFAIEVTGKARLIVD